MLSPRSRGKGSRLSPIGHSRGKQKRAEWRKQATHAVDGLSNQSGESEAVDFPCPYGLSPAETIYLFDHEIARAGILYQAELHGQRRQFEFRIQVAVDDVAKVRAIIARITR